MIIETAGVLSTLFLASVNLVGGKSVTFPAIKRDAVHLSHFCEETARLLVRPVQK